MLLTSAASRKWVAGLTVTLVVITHPEASVVMQVLTVLKL